MGQTNAICSDSGDGVSIKTLEECQNAVPFIKLKIPGIPNMVNIEDDGEFPKGCYAYWGGKFFGFAIYFNTHEYGSQELSSREVCIAERR